MALIKCPECGKPNVSDTAEQCPECGYRIKELFEREKRKQLVVEQREQWELKRQQEFEKLKPELEQKLREIDNSPYPEKPNYIKSMFSESGSGLTYATIFALIILFLHVQSPPQNLL